MQTCCKSDLSTWSLQPYRDLKLGECHANLLCNCVADGVAVAQPVSRLEQQRLIRTVRRGMLVCYGVLCLIVREGTSVQHKLEEDVRALVSEGLDRIEAIPLQRHELWRIVHGQPVIGERGRLESWPLPLYVLFSSAAQCLLCTLARLTPDARLHMESE